MQQTHRQFLESIRDEASHSSAIRIGTVEEELTLSFWSWSEVEAALPMRSEWGVPLHFVPFYGDWHDLFCLNEANGHVVALNDERAVVYEWESVAEFQASLLSRAAQGSSNIRPVLVASAISPELQSKINELLKTREA
jgi:hypothetical protein